MQTTNNVLSTSCCPDTMESANHVLPIISYRPINADLYVNQPIMSNNAVSANHNRPLTVESTNNVPPANQSRFWRKKGELAVLWGVMPPPRVKPVTHEIPTR